MKLLTNEEKLITSNNNKIILTNHRIQMKDSFWGQSFTVIIFLEDISSIEIKYKSVILFLILGFICMLGGFYLFIENSGILGFVLSGIFFAFWWFTRKHIVSISSKGGSSLNFMVQGIGDEKINEFIHNVSHAKLTRINQLAKA